MKGKEMKRGKGSKCIKGNVKLKADRDSGGLKNREPEGKNSASYKVKEGRR